MSKLRQTNNASYKTFAYAAIEYLKTREKQAVDVSFYNDSIHKYLSKIPKTRENYPILFDIHILLGNSNKRRELIEPALQNYVIAEDFALLANDIERIIKIKGNIALIYQDMEEFDKALDKGKQTLELIEKNKNKLAEKYYSSKYKKMSNVAAIYATLYKNDTLKNKYAADSSLHYYNTILRSKDFNFNDYYLGKVYYGIGTIYSLKRQLIKASFFLEKSLELFRKSKSQSYLYKGYYNNGYNYYMLNDIEKAKKTF
ncbi:hypothetical protein P8625_05860 [Tenacibaculum tangerinum]|uniref:Tetratricopeptide repeat protein n=1 Tax=Tenacibaculum tangerinum TaxID=3038772 RepID=A0ABY8L7T1_9FLAO|nr:hypothetical protein [Tenacibaculum tangerinum]WGH76682.1 hypothetical protein P8625_05860 [Tenacibaculum tangerinum]